MVDVICVCMVSGSLQVILPLTDSDILFEQANGFLSS